MIGKAATKTTEVQTNHKKILWIVIYQQIEQPRKNGHISINIYPAKTESKRNWTFEQKDDLKINRICKEKKKRNPRWRRDQDGRVREPRIHLFPQIYLKYKYNDPHRNFYWTLAEELEHMKGQEVSIYNWLGQKRKKKEHEAGGRDL